MRTMRTVCLFLQLAWAGACLLHAGEETTFKVYNLKSPDPAALADVAQMIVGDDGTVLLDKTGNRLLVRAPEAAHRELAAILEKLDRVAPNIRIDVSIQDNRQTSDRRAGVETHGAVIIGPAGTTADIALKPHLQSRTTDSRSGTQQTLLVRSGAGGTLFVGDIVFFRDWLVGYGRRHGYLDSSFSEREIGASLQVEATAVGDGSMVQIRLVPQITALQDGKLRKISVINAATTVTTPNGQPVTISEFGEHDTLYQNYLLGMARGSSDRQLSITLTPTIMPVEP